MSDSGFGLVKGVQQPRIRSVPPAATSWAALDGLELLDGIGFELDPWQKQDLTDGMGESADWKCPRCTHRMSDPVPCPDHPDAQLINPWQAFQVVEIDPRQNGKSEIEVAREIIGALVLEEPLQIYSAHLFDTAMEIFLRLETIILNCDELAREVKHRGSKMVGIKHSHGEEGVEFRNGCRIRFKARTGSGGRGFSCDRLALDEAMILPERFLGATLPTLSARANPQLWYFGSAPDEEDPTHDGVVLAKCRARAQAGGDGSIAYFERSADFEGDPSFVPASVLDDPYQWALANPGLGVRITCETVANERKAMGARQFAVERLGIGAWPDISEDAGRFISVADWSRLSDPASKPKGGLTFALDIDPGQAWATLAAAGERDDGLWHVGVVEHDRGVGWVAGKCRQWLDRFPEACFVVDPRADYADLLAELDEAGVRVVSTSAKEYKDACGGFYRAVTEGQLRYMPPQPELDAAAAGAQTQPLLDAWKWSRKDSQALVTPLIACTLALWGARTQAQPAVWNLTDLAAKSGKVSQIEPEVVPTGQPGVNFIPISFR